MARADRIFSDAGFFTAPPDVRGLVGLLAIAADGRDLVTLARGATAAETVRGMLGCSAAEAEGYLARALAADVIALEGDAIRILACQGRGRRWPGRPRTTTLEHRRARKAKNQADRRKKLAQARATASPDVTGDRPGDTGGDISGDRPGDNCGDVSVKSVKPTSNRARNCGDRPGDSTVTAGDRPGDSPAGPSPLASPLPPSSSVEKTSSPSQKEPSGDPGTAREEQGVRQSGLFGPEAPPAKPRRTPRHPKPVPAIDTTEPAVGTPARAIFDAILADPVFVGVVLGPADFARRMAARFPQLRGADVVADAGVFVAQGRRTYKDWNAFLLNQFKDAQERWDARAKPALGPAPRAHPATRLPPVPVPDAYDDGGAAERAILERRAGVNAAAMEKKP